MSGTGIANHQVLGVREIVWLECIGFFGGKQMVGWFQGAIGTYAQALTTYGSRAEIIASNIANADTPGYKARDIDFRAVLAGVEQQGHLQGSHARHFGAGGGTAQTDPLYRQPYQPALDGNTVETHVEQVAFAENAMRYQASLSFLGGSVKSLLLAIKGE